MNEVYRLLGNPVPGGVWIIADHASNRVPDDLDLGIDPALLHTHIAIDTGVAEVAEIMAEQPGFSAFLGHVSRLVCDYNRDEGDVAVIPVSSDGHAISGNDLNDKAREQRLARFHRPYHMALAKMLADIPPALILSLHSFTPRLASRPEEHRPWQAGVLYNQDARAARRAIAWLSREGCVVGDQEPYSGLDLNATMNRHAEAPGRRYVGLELRQDEVASVEQQQLWANRLMEMCEMLLTSDA